jgi:hypothetical protein
MESVKNGSEADTRLTRKNAGRLKAAPIEALEPSATLIQHQRLTLAFVLLLAVTGLIESFVFLKPCYLGWQCVAQNCGGAASLARSAFVLKLEGVDDVVTNGLRSLSKSIEVTYNSGQFNSSFDFRTTSQFVRDIQKDSTLRNGINGGRDFRNGKFPIAQRPSFNDLALVGNRNQRQLKICLDGRRYNSASVSQYYPQIRFVLTPCDHELFLENGFQRRFRLLLQQLSLLLHFAPHPMGNKSVDARGDSSAERSDKRPNFKRFFPSWNLLLAAFAGIFGISWGWWNLRNERRENLAAVAFVSGILLWGYAYCGLLWFSFQF